jgi:hypothetical protein
MTICWTHFVCIMPRRRNLVGTGSKFSRAQKTAINRAYRGGATAKEAYASIGMSYSSGNAIRKGVRAPGPRLQRRFIESRDFTGRQPASSDQIGWFDTTGPSGKVDPGIFKLQVANATENNLTFREATRLLNAIERGEYPGVTIEDFRAGRVTVERPTVTRTIKVKGKNVTVSWKLGRGKSDEQRARIEAQLRAQGVDPRFYQRTYNEATGYTAGGM